jgi:hypothetical protein
VKRKAAICDVIIDVFLDGLQFFFSAKEGPDCNPLLVLECVSLVCWPTLKQHQVHLQSLDLPLCMPLLVCAAACSCTATCSSGALSRLLQPLAPSSPSPVRHRRTTGETGVWLVEEGGDIKISKVFLHL